MKTIAELQAFIGVAADGVWGAKSLAMLESIIHPDAHSNAPDVNAVDDRSEKNIATLHRKVQPLARALVNAAKEHGITIKVTSGTRTYAEQDALYDRHDGTTRARGGYSNHNFGLAFDVTIDALPDDVLQPVWESPAYKTVGKLGEDLGLSWGGDWQSFKDEPHFELHPEWAKHLSESEMLAELRDRHDVGRDAFA